MIKCNDLSRTKVCSPLSSSAVARMRFCPGALPFFAMIFDLSHPFEVIRSAALRRIMSVCCPHIILTPCLSSELLLLLLLLLLFKDHLKGF